MSLTRRRLVQGFGVLAAAPWFAGAAETARSGVAPLALPLALRQIVNHIGISVPDVVASARFYSHVFDGPKLLGQAKPALRYSIGFYPGAMAIGGLSASDPSAPGGLPVPAPSEARSGAPHAFIDHFCMAAAPFDLAAWRARLDAERLRFFARGTFVEVAGIPVQLLGGHEPSSHPAGAVAPKGAAGGGFHPMPPLYSGAPLVQAHGFAFVSLHVSELHEATTLFRKLFGLTAPRATRGGLAFSLGDIELRLEQAADPEKARIASYGIRVARFDRSKLAEQLTALGATIKATSGRENRGLLRFADPDGIECELSG